MFCHHSKFLSDSENDGDESQMITQGISFDTSGQPLRHSGPAISLLAVLNRCNKKKHSQAPHPGITVSEHLQQTSEP
jgi:hypothetical protein